MSIMRYVLPSASFIFLQINSKYDFILYKFRFSLFFFSPTHTVFFRNYYLFRIIKGSVGILFFLLLLLSPSIFPDDSPHSHVPLTLLVFVYLLTFLGRKDILLAFYKYKQSICIYMVSNIFYPPRNLNIYLL